MPPPPAMSDGEPDAKVEPEAEPVELPPWSVAVVVLNGDPGDGSTEPLPDAAMGGFAEAEAVVRVDQAGVPPPKPQRKPQMSGAQFTCAGKRQGRRENHLHARPRLLVRKAVARALARRGVGPGRGWLVAVGTCAE